MRQSDFVKFFCLTGLFLLISLVSPVPTLAQNSSVAPMIRLIEGGKLPEQRLPTVLGMICKRGDETDLEFVFSRTLQAEGLSPENRVSALELLAQTAIERNLKPSGDLSRLRQFLDSQQSNPQSPDSQQPEPSKFSQQEALQRQAIQLIGLWKVQALASDLSSLLKTESSPETTETLLKTLASLGGKESQAQISSLTQPETPRPLRKQAIIALAGLDLSAASQAAAEYLKDASSHEKFDGLLQPFLARSQGPELLGKAISSQKISPDVAKLALRSMLVSGRNDQALSAPLSAAAGLDSEMKPLSEQELQNLVQEVLTQGDSARGEQIFRREELNCYKCHAIGQAGGNIGPDLSAVGGSSPIDYLINSLLLPSQSIKEAYKTIQILDLDGLTHTGIVVDRNDDRMILRDAQGKETNISIDDIEFEKEGDSLMPAGLTKFLTHQEFVDLIKYLSALGKDQGYVIPTEPTVYRWRVFSQTPASLLEETISNNDISALFSPEQARHWRPLYSYAGGSLPVSEAKNLASQPVFLAYAELNVSVPGQIVIQLNSSSGVTAWLDDQKLTLDAQQPFEIKTGPHTLLLRIDTRQLKPDQLKVSLVKGPAPAAEYSIKSGE